MWFLLKYLWILFVYNISSWLYISIVKLNYNVDYFSDWLWKDYKQIDHVYDYIIVGAGTAGCTLANKLSENRTVKILLIEAGGQPYPMFDIPIVAPMLQQTPYDWQFVTVPQKDACLGLNSNRSMWPRGKIFGGSSRLNYMMYMRGHPADFDTWTSPDCAHWTRDEIKYYFKRTENQKGRYANDKVFHSTKGPMYVSDLADRSGLVNALLGASEELSLGVGDLNGATHTGFMEAQVTGKDGARYSADRMLYGRTNVKVLFHTHVTKVLLRMGYEAYGVLCESHGRYFRVRARRDVIVAAGTVGSPHLLMLSGIGPASHLSEHKIKVAVDLPVGDNLQEHVSTGMDLVINNQSSPFSWNTIVNPLNSLNYLLHESGPLTHPGCEVVGVLHSAVNKHGPPDLQFMALPGGLSSDGGVLLKRLMGISDKLFREYFAPLVGTPVATILPTILHPQSRGYVRLQSRNPHDQPIIDPRYLSHPDDVNILIRGLDIISRIAVTDAMAQVGSYLYTKPLPPCSHNVFGSYPYWECYVRYLTITAYHPVGTCRMGAHSDPTTVVDHTLRVHGTSRLRVVDASVMPTMPSANINAAVMMIAEKAADMINNFWQTQQSTCRQVDVFFIDKPIYCFPS